MGFWQAPPPTPRQRSQPQSSNEQSHCLVVTKLGCSWLRPCDYGFLLPQVTQKANDPGQNGCFQLGEFCHPRLGGREWERGYERQGRCALRKSGHRLSVHLYGKASEVLLSLCVSASLPGLGQTTLAGLSSGLTWLVVHRQALYRMECPGAVFPPLPKTDHLRQAWESGDELPVSPPLFWVLCKPLGPLGLPDRSRGLKRKSGSTKQGARGDTIRPSVGKTRCSS